MSAPLPLIKRLPPMRIAAVRAVSATPERDAWEKLRCWAEPLGLLLQPRLHPVYGFNNPPPVADHAAYGYEFWIRVDAHTATEGEIELKDFPGGLYATCTCRLVNDAAGPIASVWRQLWEQIQSSPYRWRRAHELEHPHNPAAAERDMVLDLLLPVEPRERAPETPVDPEPA